MRIAIAGAGCISACGGDRVQSLHSRLNPVHYSTLDGQSGQLVYRVPDRYTTDGQIEAFAQRYPPDRAGRLALYAAREAVNEAGWQETDFAIVVGCSRGPTHSWEEYFETYRAEGEPPLRTSPRTTLGSIGFTLSRFFGSRSLVSSLSVTCSSGLHAIIHGVALLRSGLARRVLVGGTEAPLTPFTLRQMASLGVYLDLQKAYAGRDGRDESPLYQPYGPKATGMVLGEGAAFLALTSEEVSAEWSVGGIGFAQEHGLSTTGIHPHGQALQSAMRAAMAESELTMPDAIVVHAPGTKQGDRAERRAIGAIFGPPAGIETITFKHLTGHTLGASGPLAAVMGMDYKPLAGVLVNAAGFGGNAASILLRREG